MEYKEQILECINSIDRTKTIGVTEDEIKIAIGAAFALVYNASEISLQEALDIAFTCNYQLPCICEKIAGLRLSRIGDMLSKAQRQELKQG